MINAYLNSPPFEVRISLHKNFLRFSDSDAQQLRVLVQNLTVKLSNTNSQFNKCIQLFDIFIVLQTYFKMACFKKQTNTCSFQKYCAVQSDFINMKSFQIQSVRNSQKFYFLSFDEELYCNYDITNQLRNTCIEVNFFMGNPVSKIC